MHWQTHTVFNQPAPLSNSNLFLSDCALRDAVSREGAEWDIELLASIGQQLGTAESLELGRLANVNPPELLRYDLTGERLDDVRFHPAWHLLMQGLCANRVHNLAWEEEARKGSFVARAARFVLHAQVEAGTMLVLPDGGRGFTIRGPNSAQRVGGHEVKQVSTLAGGVARFEADVRSIAPEIPATEIDAANRALRAMAAQESFVRAPKAAGKPAG